jgi:hypothetical protein
MSTSARSLNVFGGTVNVPDVTALLKVSECAQPNHEVIFDGVRSRSLIALHSTASR